MLIMAYFTLVVKSTFDRCPTRVINIDSVMDFYRAFIADD